MAARAGGPRKALLYYTRAVRSRRITQAIARALPVMLSAASVTAQPPAPELAPLTAGLVTSVERFTTDEGQPPVEIQFHLNPAAGAAQSQRVVDTTRAALRLFGEWFGPYPFDRLTVIDVPWRSPLAGTPYPGVALVRTRWLAPVNDLALERGLIGAIARQYWTLSRSDPMDARESLTDAVVLYAATRAIHADLEGRHFATHRFFGGFVPFVTRSIAWSPRAADPNPRLRRFPELETSAAPDRETLRALLAIQTLERYVGWPALQQALLAFRERALTIGSDSAGLMNLLGEQQGRDLSWFLHEAFRPDTRFDYAVSAFTSDALPGSSGFATHVEFRRLGDAVFAGTSRLRVAELDKARSLPITVTFADGTVIDEWWDGRDAELTVRYVSKSRAARAGVDPAAMLLLDADRANNTRTIDPRPDPIGARLSLHWLVWLQDLMLTCTALA